MEDKKKIYNFVLDFTKLILLYLPVPENPSSKWMDMIADFSRLDKKYRDDSDAWNLFIKRSIALWWNYVTVKNGGVDEYG